MGWVNMAEVAESGGDPVAVWCWGTDSLSSFLSAAWTSGERASRISRARLSSAAGSSAPSGKTPMLFEWKAGPEWLEWLEWAEWRLLRLLSSMLFKWLMSSLATWLWALTTFCRLTTSPMSSLFELASSKDCSCSAWTWCWVAMSCSLSRPICWVAGKGSSVCCCFLGAGAFRRMLSRLSFLSARNSGCRNSQA